MLLELLQEDGFKPRKKGNNRNEYCSPCPWCGGDDRFVIWAEGGERGTGSYWCRQCEKRGDVIQYLMDHRGKTYHEAATFEGKQAGDYFFPARQKKKTASKQAASPDLWKEKAGQLVDYTHNQLLNNKQKMAWLLEERGLSRETVIRHKLGYLERYYGRERADWGLPEVLGDNGKPKKLFIQKGLVLPSFNSKTGELEAVRIRRSDESQWEKWGKYSVLPGGEDVPFIIYDKGGVWISKDKLLPSSPLGTAPAKSRPVVNLSYDREMQTKTKKVEFTRFSRAAPVMICESQLDAILIKQEIKEEPVTIIALQSAAAKIKGDALSIINSAPFLIISTDNDEAGEAAAERFLKQFRRHSVNLILSEEFGKDITEGFLNGLNPYLFFLAGAKFAVKKKRDLVRWDSSSRELYGKPCIYCDADSYFSATRPDGGAGFTCLRCRARYSSLLDIGLRKKDTYPDSYTRI